jgi:tRNA-splicing ligase RtcB (3'-phosphate/5'-hydroxy nucleic acid ligase)
MVSTPMEIRDNIPVWGEIDDDSFQQIQRCYGIFRRAAMMADHHKGYSVPIGGVIAHEYLISPSGVGYDIGCGNKAVCTDADAKEIRRNIRTIMDDLWKTISFGIGRKNAEKVDHELFDDDPAWDIKHGAGKTAWKLRDLRDMARQQLGTVGSGNHFVDLLVDEQDRVWVGVHFGSRGLGHKIAQHFMRRAGGRDDMDSPPAVLDTRTDEGQEYIAAMKLGGRYAYAGRDWVCERVVKLLGATVIESVHNHHNFAWRENHEGVDLWVVRKGATPAGPGVKGFIGGSMGDRSVIIEGVDSPESQLSYYSTVHGAGRTIGRREAKRTIDEQDMLKWVHDKRVELRGAGVDESPQCYKRIDDVLAAHGNSIRILHTLEPIGVAMAGPDVRDPYKD